MDVLLTETKVCNLDVAVLVQEEVLQLGDCVSAAGEATEEINTEEGNIGMRSKNFLPRSSGEAGDRLFISRPSLQPQFLDPTEPLIAHDFNITLFTAITVKNKMHCIRLE